MYGTFISYCPYSYAVFLLGSWYHEAPSSIFHLPSSIFHLPSSILPLIIIDTMTRLQTLRDYLPYRATLPDLTYCSRACFFIFRHVSASHYCVRDALVMHVIYSYGLRRMYLVPVLVCFSNSRCPPARIIDYCAFVLSAIASASAFTSLSPPHSPSSSCSVLSSSSSSS